MLEAALAQIKDSGAEVAAAVLAGGGEKLPAETLVTIGGAPVLAGSDARAVLDGAIVEFAPDEVLDLSDEPVLDYRHRHELAAVALWREVPYRGADFLFTPPPLPHVCRKPSIAVIATGKRTGKTAIAAFTARALLGRGLEPIIVAMGRGGPVEPEVLRGDEISLSAADLVSLADAGKHAASDYIEDALVSGVATVGCRRCGGGLAGGVSFSNVGRGVEVANDLPGDLIVLEGSGAAIPPARADVTILVVPASVPEEHLAGYMGPYRLLLSDFVVVTMCEEPFGTPSRISDITARIKSSFRSTTRGQPRDDIEVVHTVFRPTPTRSVDGAGIFVATTAPERAGPTIKRHLETAHGCRVVAMTHSLSHRGRLERELDDFAGTPDVLLCEVKAVGVDVAMRWALRNGIDVVYLDNVPHGVEGDDPASLCSNAVALATTRFEAVSS